MSKNDAKFIWACGLCVYTEAEIIKRSVTGSQNRNPKQRKEVSCPAISPIKLQWIYGELSFFLCCFGKFYG